MPATLLSSMAFAGYVFFLTSVGGVAIGLAPFVALCILILAGYAAGFAYAWTALHPWLVWLGLALVPAALLPRFMRPSADTANGVETLCGHVALALSMAYFSWYFEGIKLSYYDEFFWGAFAKSFFHEGGLWTSLSPLARDDMSQAYPPMPAILANIFMPPGGPYTEDAIAVGGMALVLCAGAMVWHYARIRMGRMPALLLGFSAACVARGVGAKVTTHFLPGYADYLQGALFVCALCIAVFETDVRRKTVLLMLGLAVLALCKQTGVVLCLGVMLVALPGLWREARRPASACLGAMACMGAAAAAAYGTWGRYAAEHITQPSGSRSLLRLGDALADPLLWPSFKAYLWAAVERPLLISPTLGWLNYGTGTLAFVLLGAALWILAHRRAGAPSPFAAQASLLTLGLAGWFMLHWYTGLMFFVEPELHAAASYERYIGPYVAGVWTILLLITCLSLARRPENGRLLAGLLTLHTATLVVVCSPLPWLRPAEVSHSPTRQRMETAANHLKTHTPPGSTIYFIPSRGSTEEEWALRYLLSPMRRGTSLMPQALALDGLPRPKVKRYLVPPREELNGLLRRNNVDYLFVFSQDAVEEHREILAGSRKTPYLARLNTAP